MGRIVQSPQAKADVLSAAKYIAVQSQSRDAAYKFIDRVDEKLTLIARHRDAGESREDLGRRIRAFPVGQYTIFYRAIVNGIEVVRLLHSARDIPRIFRTGES